MSSREHSGAAPRIQADRVASTMVTTANGTDRKGASSACSTCATEAMMPSACAAIRCLNWLNASSEPSLSKIGPRRTNSSSREWSRIQSATAATVRRRISRSEPSERSRLSSNTAANSVKISDRIRRSSSSLLPNWRYTTDFARPARRATSRIARSASAGPSSSSAIAARTI
ncbi:hypothetical protein [Mycolicibacterium insubricum]|uniref:hypothetical protein n=1 Tax=Mycolicibacterium insubricum TaxID=444597 RepID=UPI0027E24B92|nr:hypothetical protein [Mycolicibacterium insubricum]